MEAPKYETLYEKVAEMQKSVTCLAIELHEAVYDDVARRWQELKTEIEESCPRILNSATQQRKLAICSKGAEYICAGIGPDDQCNYTKRCVNKRSRI
jgi:hypothetical protein